MKLNEIAERTGLTKRAVKYYEQKGLITIKRDANGYRCYDEHDLEVLKKISLYRRLGISIGDIQQLLKGKAGFVETVIEKKNREIELAMKEKKALMEYLKSGNVDEALAVVDYQTVAKKIMDQLPGYYGYVLMNHFYPFLDVAVTCEKQQNALNRILEFWDNAEIKIPLLLRINGWLTYQFMPKQDLKHRFDKIEKTVSQMLNPTEEEYEKIKKQVKRNVKLRNSLLYKYHPVSISNRRLMKRLQDSGYNDIFIPSMLELSDSYRLYHTALMTLNQRICQDLGLYYDSSYRLIMKR